MNIEPNFELANEFFWTLGAEYNLSKYLQYYLSKTYGNAYGNKSITRQEMIEILKDYEPDIKSVSRVGFYKKMLARGYSDERLADMFKVGVLGSVVAGILRCNGKDLLELINESQLKAIGVKPIHPYYGPDYDELVLSASSVFAYINKYYGEE